MTPNLLLILLRCLPIVPQEIFKSFAISLLVRPFFIISQISISLDVKLDPASVSLVPKEEVIPLIFFCNKSTYTCVIPLLVLVFELLVITDFLHWLLRCLLSVSFQSQAVQELH